MSLDCENASLGGSTFPEADGTFSSAGYVDRCEGGTNTLTLGVQWTDAFGANHYDLGPLVSVIVKEAPGLHLREDVPAYFSPNGDGVEDNTAIPFCVAKASTLTTTIKNAAGVVVRTLGPTEVPGVIDGGCDPDLRVIWNGRADAGATAPDGLYTVQLRAVLPSGAADTVSTQRGVESRPPGHFRRPSLVTA